MYALEDLVEHGVLFYPGENWGAYNNGSRPEPGLVGHFYRAQLPIPPAEIRAGDVLGMVHGSRWTKAQRRALRVPPHFVPRHGLPDLLASVDTLRPIVHSWQLTSRDDGSSRLQQFVARSLQSKNARSERVMNLVILRSPRSAVSTPIIAATDGEAIARLLLDVGGKL